MIDLDAIRGRCDAATEGPWENCRGFVRSTARGSEMQGPGFRVSTSTLWVAECRDGEAFYNPDGNAAFIAHARADVPALLAVIDGLAKALEECAAPIPGFMGKSSDDILTAVLVEFRRRAEQARAQLAAIEARGMTQERKMRNG